MISTTAACSNVNADFLIDELCGEHETFSFIGKRWDVRKGYAIALEKGIEQSEFDVSVCFQFLGFMRVDKGYAKSSNRETPLLFVEMEQGLILVDGWHRIFKARHESVSHLKAYFLNVEQSKSIELP